MEAYRSLILRGNRSLGAYLAEHGLITDEAFSRVNERLLELLQTGALDRANILRLLAYELKALDENKLVDHLVQEHGVALIDPTHLKYKNLAEELGYDNDLCRATGTIPFEHQAGIVCVATSFYPSKPVVKHWEDLLKKHIFWYVATSDAIATQLETLA